MKISKLNILSFTKQKTFLSVNLRRRAFSLLFVFLAFNAFFLFQNSSSAQVQTLPPTSFKIGERLTYNISFEKFKNSAYAELYTVSRGKLGEKDAVELRSKIKTNELVSAAFYLLDEKRTTFAAAETGLPLYVRKVSNAGVLPEETINNYLIEPTLGYDLLTLIYQIRKVGGIGTFSLVEDGKTYNVSLQTAVSERVETDAGGFETSVSTVTSDYLTEKGIQNLRVNFSVDEQRIPVLIRLKTAKGTFRAELASIQIIEPETETGVPTPTPNASPTPIRTPTPVPTPAPYIENQPLSADLPFKLGETLNYQVSALNKRIGIVTLAAKERKQFLGQDSLLLSAAVTGTEAGANILNLDDEIKAQVNPDSLAPKFIELRFGGLLSRFNQTAIFDQKAGTVTFNGQLHPEIPVGTHSILSLAYAIRAFNLKPSKDPNNPVNDTRVAVFLDDAAYVFTIRPSNAEIITLQNEKVSAQLLSITTGIPALDRLNLRLWLSTDESRVPLRLSAGDYQADLIEKTLVMPKSLSVN